MANILSLTTIKDKKTLQDYMAHLGILFRDDEIKSLILFRSLITKDTTSIQIFDHYFIGYSIPQISKEFDLLRIDSKSIINIELKSIFDYDKALKQLQQNHTYLKYLSKELFLYTFSSSTGKIYALSSDLTSLKEISATEIVEKLLSQNTFFQGDLDTLFTPSNYLVSPFNATEKFIEGEYFLTNQQDEIKTKTLTSFKHSGGNIVGIKGSAGTGKTLLIYDIAKTLMNSGSKILIVHTGQLNEGHVKLRDSHNYNIIPVKALHNIMKDNGLAKYDCIIIDESQRLYENQVTNIFNTAQTNSINAIFSFDPRQILRDSEKSDHLVKTINDRGAPSYELTKKIRTNKEIAGFIRALFNLRHKDTVTRSERISVIHFNNYKAAKLYIESSRSDYTLTTLTPSTIPEYEHAIDVIGTSNTSKGTAHQIIGQEFDNVIVVIDGVFFYSPDGDLVSHKRTGVLYGQREMLFQIVTRTRNKLEIVVVNNEPVFREILGLLKG